MQIRYIGHASLAIDVAGKHLLCDPWWNGPAYTGQWHQYPVPQVEPADTQEVDFVYISHGHEDHLHVPTLRSIRREAVLIIPRLRDTGMRDFLRSLGFRRVLELGHGERRCLAPGLHATLYLNREDSILALEGDGRTLLDANEALHASPRHVIDHLCEQIRSRHSRIDALFAGYGGASWFPNCMQITDDPGFDPAARERALVEGFAHVVRRLEPRMALPFAASFVLLEDRLRWINDARFRAPSPCEELRRLGLHDVRTHFLLPGDRILDDQILAANHRRPTPEEAEEDLQRLFAMPLAELRQRHEPDEPRHERLLAVLRGNAARRARRILAPGERLLCRIDLRDAPETSLLVDCERGQVRIERCDRLRLAPMVLTMRRAILEALATQDYGFESITIGYGAMLQLRRRDLPLRNRLVAILGRRPLPPSRAEAFAAFLRAPLRRCDLWWRDRHWRHLEARLRRGEVQQSNDLYSSDPERWSPLRARPAREVRAGC